MRILTKYLLSTFLENFGKQFLMFLSIVISTALLISSLAVVDLLTGIYMEKSVKQYGDYNIQISQEQGKVWNLEDVEELKNIRRLSMLTAFGRVSDYENRDVQIIGAEEDELQEFSPMKAIEQSGAAFQGKTAIISEKTKENLDVELGDSLNLSFEGKEETYRIIGVYETESLFQGDMEERFSVVIPQENLAAYEKGKTNCTSVYACVEEEQSDAWAESFNKAHKEQSVICAKTYDQDVIKSQFEWIQLPMLFMLLITLIMSAFIISCTFRLIIGQRLPVLGTFFSQGASSGQIYGLFLMEGLLYGVAGGLAGCLAGNYLTRFIANYSVHSLRFSAYEDCQVPGSYFLAGFLFSILFSAAMVIIPVHSIKKIPLKEIILNMMEQKKQRRRGPLICGLCFLAAAAVMALIAEPTNYVLSMPCISFFLIGAVVLIGYAAYAVCRPAAAFFRGKSAVGMLAFNNVGTSGILKNNITLITVCITAVLIISALSASITEAINGSYAKMNFDICVTVSQAESEEAGSAVYENFDPDSVIEIGTISTRFDGDPLKPMYLFYVDPEEYRDFENYMSYEDKEAQLRKLDGQKNGIIVSQRIARTYGIEAGDTISVESDGEEYQLNVLSILDARMYSSGNYNLITRETAAELFGFEYPSQYYIRTEIPKEDVKQELSGYGAEITDKQDQVDAAEEEMRQFTDILSVFSYVIMIMGALAVISNVTISFLQRKKDMAVMTSIGISPPQKTGMLLLESLTVAVAGIVFGVISGGISLYLLGDVFTLLMLDLNLGYDGAVLGVISLATVLIVMLTAVPVVIKCEKLDIVKELKYE
ncbi:ABC transporter permease [Zhenpiania hominis]|uniref:ABC transporter permease n=1 Tax=Zhenpiania hominis TaxID=2763644 RepID=A0A923NIM8_9FIRM|nr:FtsX-like permease family protein [Zhenpiania hominis]MBC6679743.1 ABC transporter permease [Zhenpiania hominis]